jgi:plastocyanin
MDTLTATPNSIVPVAEGISLPRENICDDGKDNDRNGLKDYEDPDCARISDTGMKDSSAPIVEAKGSTNSTNSTHNTLPQKSVIELEANVADDDNTYFISISGGHDRDIRTISFSQDYGYSPQELTVKKGSKLVWLNQDPAKTHGINVVDKVSGKIIFEHPGIRFGESVSYEFQGNGEFTFFDPVYQSMTGRISVPN